MTQKDKITLIIVTLVTAVISFVISRSIFNSPAKHTETAPVVKAISNTLPDVRNDSNYNTFLNSKALDPTQPIQIGGSQNTTPFH
jgi:hypothetical protein